ncbi:MAG: hypothetical protein KatS3mg009_1668 [Acidimicrobiia bacterium]|nr:MAG: hypothetical protein KatS3mg009_1668 [Acidimicrobiia bacterium]
MTPRRDPGRPRLALALVGALALGACGDDDGVSDAAGRTTTEPPPRRAIVHDDRRAARGASRDHHRAGDATGCGASPPGDPGFGVADGGARRRPAR